MNKVCSVILAAGNGKRMKSKRPKAMCEVLFKPMIRWVTDSAREAGIGSLCVVVGRDSEELEAVLPPGTAVARQSFEKGAGYGTGYAAMLARDFIAGGGYEDVAVLFGDSPLSAEDLSGAYRLHKEEKNAVTLISAQVEDPTGYGRVLRRDGALDRIVEESDADGETREVREISSGVFWFDAAFLLEGFGRLGNHNAKGEYYINDLVDAAREDGRRMGVFQSTSPMVLGANSRQDLAELNGIARDMVLRRHREAGVDIPFADGVVIGPDVAIGPDTRILPGTILRGETVIGEGCEIGPNSHLENARVGDGCHIVSSYIDSAQVEEGVRIGPMSYLRPGSHIGAGAKIGDFVEIKNSAIGGGTSVAHLTYIGDSDVGKNCNFGCGVVTVNYDGNNKHRTKVGDGVFVGCNSNLVAPVTMGDGSYSAAGTTVTEDVPPDSLAIGRARQEVKEGWAKRRGLFRR